MPDPAISPFASASALSPFDTPPPATNGAYTGVKPVSWKRLPVAGLLVTVYGLDELTPVQAQHATCLWLLHGRGEQQDDMSSIAAGMLHAWAAHSSASASASPSPRGLLCATFDQRNHGSRQLHAPANNSWKQGNATHAQDMFASYAGTAHDLSLLLTQLPLYLPASVHLSDHCCAGVSLGGHATWVALLAEPRISAGLVFVGCPDFARLMTDRAVRSQLPTALASAPPGAAFLGSPDFPPPLLAELARLDPATLLLGDDARLPSPSPATAPRARALAERALAGKSICCLFGGRDRLVPHALSAPFLAWLQAAIAPGAALGGLGIAVREFVDPAARHEVSPAMRQEAERWLCEFLARPDEGAAAARRRSRI